MAESGTSLHFLFKLSEIRQYGLMKQSILATALVGWFLLAPCADEASASSNRLITQQDAARHGLTRAWFAQVPLDPGRSRVTHVRLFEGTGQLPDTLFVQTDQAVVHALDAETGQTLWSRTVGNRAHPTLPVGINRELVGVANGGRVYLLDRANGRLLWERRIKGVPANGVVLTDQFVFVPLVSGLVLAYPIEKQTIEEEGAALPDAADLGPKKPAEEGEAPAEPKPPAPQAAADEPYRPFALKQDFIDPLTCVSFGRITTQPVFTLEDKKNQYLVWATTRGLFITYVDLQRQSEFAVRYQLRTRSEIVTQPTYLPPAASDDNPEGLIFAASRAGEIHAVSATEGAQAWRYAIGQPITEPIVPIRGRVYVVTELGACLCLDALTGQEYWSAQGTSQFIAASQKRIYVADRDGQIRSLDAESGATVDGLYAADMTIKFRNLMSDRIYLATSSGLVQCLRETEQLEPIRYRKAAATSVEAAAGENFVPAEPAKPEEKPADQTEPSDENPFS